MYTFPIPKPLIDGYPFLAFVTHITDHVLTAGKFKTLAGSLRTSRILKAAVAEDGVCKWEDGDYDAIKGFITEEDPEKALPLPVLNLTQVVTAEDGTETKQDFVAPAHWFAGYVSAILDAKHSD